MIEKVGICGVKPTLMEAAARVLRPPGMQVVEHIGVRVIR
ncbi:hypothetical protein ACVIQY_003605 [Bradyrhizobium sp. USDA 3051]